MNLIPELEDSEAEDVLLALGGRLCWEWSLRKSYYAARTERCNYTIFPPEKPSEPWWNLSIMDARLVKGLLFPGLPPDDASVRPAILCQTLDEAKILSEHHAITGSLPEQAFRKTREREALDLKVQRHNRGRQNRRYKLLLRGATRGKRRQ